MPWLTTEETADRYRISVSGLLKQRRENRKPGALGRRVGKRVLWASEDLDAYDGHQEPETFGALHALVLEARGINKRLDAVLVELRKPHELEFVLEEGEEE